MIQPPQSPQSPETVNHPSHYTPGDHEVYKVLSIWGIKDPYIWNAIKYLARAHKKGNYLEDLQKAAWYLNLKTQEMTAPTPPTPPASERSFIAPVQQVPCHVEDLPSKKENQQ